MSRILGLREFVHKRWDPRLLIVDARDRPTGTLDNRFFTWVRVPVTRNPGRIVDDLMYRNLVIVHEDEERALDLDHVFETLELRSAALEGGERGWAQALLVEASHKCGDVTIVTMHRLALERRVHLVVRGSDAVVVQASGSLVAIREAVRHHGATIRSVVDIMAPEDETSVRLAFDMHVRRYGPLSHRAREASKFMREISLI